MRVKLLVNLKVSSDDIQTVGRIFDDNFDAFPNWLQGEIKRKKYIEVLPDLVSPKENKIPEVSDANSADLKKNTTTSPKKEETPKKEPKETVVKEALKKQVLLRRPKK